MDRLSGGEGKGLLWEKKNNKIGIFYIFIFIYVLPEASRGNSQWLHMY